jgi:hypothetical protein
MSKAEKNAKLIEVKRDLMVKWEHRAQLASSRPLKTSLERRAAKYRRQVADLSRK